MRLRRAPIRRRAPRTQTTIRRLAFAVLAGLLASGAAAPASAQELTVSAAISLKDAVAEIGRAFEQAHPGVVLRYNFASSGALQSQIEAGAPVDLFLSAGQAQMDALEKRGLILPATRRVFAENVLVAIVPAGSRLIPAGPRDLTQAAVGRIAVGDPRTVPAGQYAEECLRTLGLWDRLRPKLIFGENVRQVLEYVARGEVEVGFVYATDLAVRKDQVREAFRPPRDSYRPVQYPGAVISGSRHAALAEAFLRLLLAPAGQAILVRDGFGSPGDIR